MNCEMNVFLMKSMWVFVEYLFIYDVNVVCYDVYKRFKKNVFVFWELGIRSLWLREFLELKRWIYVFKFGYIIIMN